MPRKPKIDVFRYTNPQKSFSLSVNSDWRLVRPKAEEKITSFLIKKDHAFQISCISVTEQHKEIIDSNQLQPQESTYGSLSFVEKFYEDKRMMIYTWLCLVDDHIIIATYILPLLSSSKKPTETPTIRHSLNSLRFHGKNNANKARSIKMESDRDYEDIVNWLDPPEKYFSFVANMKENREGLKKVEFTDINILNLYSLLKATISPEPNGFFSIVREGFPMDNMIWWDFVFECKKGFVQIWRTANLVEAHYIIDDPSFDLRKFLEANIKKHIKAILDIKKSYTKYISYINQYRSYKDCVDHLWKELSTIDSSIPTDSLSHIRANSESVMFSDKMKKFIDNSIRFHTMGKSLVLNAAFEVESFLNLVIRVGAIEQLREYNDVLNKHLKSNFSDRLKNMKFYSQILTKNVDMENKAIKDAMELMTLRNKYVHFDESSSHNRLEDVYFDHDFPLHEISKYRPAIEAFKQMFHTPDLATIRKAYETANRFVSYIQSLFPSEARDYLAGLLMQNPIGYNTVRKNYAVIYKELVIEFFVSATKKPALKKKTRKSIKKKKK